MTRIALFGSFYRGYYLLDALLRGAHHPKIYSILYAFYIIIPTDRPSSSVFDINDE